jgi:hypothetical protein
VKRDIDALVSGGGMRKRDARFEVENAPIKATLNDIANRIGGAIPEGYGFLLMLMSYGVGGSLFYLSSAERENVIELVQEWINKQRAADATKAAELNPDDPTTIGIRHQWHKVVAMLLVRAAGEKNVDPMTLRVTFKKSDIEAVVGLGDVAVGVQDDADGLTLFLMPEDKAIAQINKGNAEMSPPPTAAEIEEAKRGE